MADATRHKIARSGFTLVELILVLAVMVAAAAIAIPALIGPLEGQRVRKAADQVRAAFNRARVQAMRTGQTHLFRFQVGSNLYVIEPLPAGDTYLEASAEVLAAMTSLAPGAGGAMAKQGAVSADDFTITGEARPEEIAEGTMFVSVANLVDLRSARVLEQLQMSGAAAQQLSEPILFYPDGTSTTTQLVLVNNQQQFVVVRLRGLTGMTEVSELLTPDEVPQ